MWAWRCVLCVSARCQMGKITVFAEDDCSFCKRAIALLDSKGVQYDLISLTKSPEWKQLMCLLANGRSSVPEIFFNDRLIGGQDDLQALEDSGELDGLLQECLDSTHTSTFPPEYRKPKSEEFLQLIPEELRLKWQKDLEALDEKLGGTSDKPISSLLIMLATPKEMIVLCTAGPGKSTFTVGAGGEKGQGEEKSYCQVVLEKSVTMFLDGPDTFPVGLANNGDYRKFGYSYYLGAPWKVHQFSGTVVAMEKEPGILKSSQTLLIEELRDSLEKELTLYLTKQ